MVEIVCIEEDSVVVVDVEGGDVELVEGFTGVEDSDVLSVEVVEKVEDVVDVLVDVV